MSINLISSQDLESKKLRRWRRLGMGVTSMVLLLYILGVAGTFWVWVRTGDQATGISGQINTASLKLRQLAETEVTIAQAHARAAAIDKYLGERKSSADQLARVQSSISGQTHLVGWNYLADGETLLVVDTPNPVEIETLVKALLANKFSQITMRTMTLVGSKWEAKINVK